MDDERAVMPESTESVERAEPLESTAARERAEIRESTATQERAVAEESTVPRERAARRESTVAPERTGGLDMCCRDNGPDEEIIIPARLAREDARRMAAELGVADVRYLVDLYYQMQDYRTSAANQRRAAGERKEPSTAVGWVFEQMVGTEDAIKRLMDAWSDLFRPGRWAKSQVGIGPILAAGCLATFDADKPTVGSWWRFAGLDPTIEWKKGEKRPYSARAKVLAWKIADSFVKQSGREKAIYGHWYRERKAFELERDTAGGTRDAAEATLAAGRIKDAATKARYETGHLPDGRLDLRARRWTAKLFLAHLHWVAYEDAHGAPPPLPYAIDILKHANLIAPPGWPCD